MTVPVDAPRIRQLSEGIPGGVRELVELFISHTAETMASLRAAVEAGRTADAQALAHRACGSAGAFGADRFLELLRGVEAAARQGARDLLPRLTADLEAEYARVQTYLTGLLEDEPKQP